jgi:hypothetical protein
MLERRKKKPNKPWLGLPSNSSRCILPCNIYQTTGPVACIRKGSRMVGAFVHVASERGACGDCRSCRWNLRLPPRIPTRFPAKSCVYG